MYDAITDMGAFKMANRHSFIINTKGKIA